MAGPEILAGLDAPASNRLSPEDEVAMLRMMLRIRQFETRAKELFLQGVIKGTAHSSIGQEAIAAGACHALEDRDFLLTHHRGHGHTLAKGADMPRMFAELMGRSTGYCRGVGGSMHIADVDRGILGANGIVGAGMGLAVGAALAAQVRGTGAVGIAFFGDGAASEGMFHEAMNLAAIWSLPLIFFCENNQYGLTTKTEAAIAGGSIAARARGYGVPGRRIDGNVPSVVFAAVDQAARRARAGEGPTLIEAMTYRWDDHSMRANLAAYRSAAEEDGWRAADPVERLRARMEAGGYLDAGRFAALVAEAEAEADAAIAEARAAPEPAMEDLPSMVLSPPPPAEPEPAPGARARTYPQAITEALAQEMARDGSVLLMGEDIASVGGIFGLTAGLAERFGTARVRDTPISENVTATAGVGAALAGLRPVIEAQLFDFVTLMMDAIVNQAAKARFMLGGRVEVPIVFRGPQGAGIRLAAQHTQSLEMLFANVPGLEIYAPATPYDAKGLMATAIRSDNPVVFLEHKLLYLGSEAPVPEAPYTVPAGRARIVRPGRDCTVIATLAMVERAVQAADRLARDGIEVEVIDPRTIRPFDFETVADSVRRTNRAVIVHEAPVFGGFGGEIAARIMADAFDWLDAPVERVGAPEMPVPYNDRLERTFMPDARDIAAAVRRACYRS